MKHRAILKLLSLLLLALSAFMVPCAVVAQHHGEGTRVLLAFLIPAASSLFFAVLVFVILPGRERPYFSAKSGYLFVSLAWVCASLAGSLPFLLSGVTKNPADAFFESMSGFTTTGASIFTDVEALPKSILLWRSTTHWLGGMGIVVLAVAIFPLLGLGGLQLMEAEAPGPSVDKITPRMAGTAKILWLIYLGLTLLEAILLRLFGMGWFEAVNHAFATMATGGFSTRNASIGAFAPAIQVIVTVFMLLAGTNFSLIFTALSGKLGKVAKDSEYRAYLFVFLAAAGLVAFDLARSGAFPAGISVRESAFQAASILTTTGFATADFNLWPGLSRVVLLGLMLIGGCAGSTGGGIKVARYLVLFKQAAVELKYLVFPRGVFTVRVNGEPVRKMAIFDAASFYFMYMMAAAACVLAVAATGADLETSLTASLASIGNIGPGLGRVGPSGNYSFFPGVVKLVLSFAMLAGRLELYTVFVLFSSAYRRR